MRHPEKRLMIFVLIAAVVMILGWGHSVAFWTAIFIGIVGGAWYGSMKGDQYQKQQAA